MQLDLARPFKVLTEEGVLARSGCQDHSDWGRFGRWERFTEAPFSFCWLVTRLHPQAGGARIRPTISSCTSSRVPIGRDSCTGGRSKSLSIPYVWRLLLLLVELSVGDATSPTGFRDVAQGLRPAPAPRAFGELVFVCLHTPTSSFANALSGPFIM